jgi:hypothetical protein
MGSRPYLSAASMVFKRIRFDILKNTGFTPLIACLVDIILDHNKAFEFHCPLLDG